MASLTAVPYWQAGVALGLLQGYVYVVAEFCHVLGLNGLEQQLRSFLPSQQQSAQVEELSTPQPPISRDQSGVQASQGSFAVLDLQSLTSALQDMRTDQSEDAAPAQHIGTEPPASAPPATAATAATAKDVAAALLAAPVPPVQPFPAQAAVAAGEPASPLAAEGMAQTGSLRVSDLTTSALLIERPTPIHSEPEQQQQLQLDELPDVDVEDLMNRLSSFPLDNISEVGTTATALSVFTAAASPEGRLDYLDEAGTGMDVAVGPLEAVEGELDITVTNSTGSNLLPPSAAIQDGTLAATAAVAAAVLAKDPLLAGSAVPKASSAVQARKSALKVTGTGSSSYDGNAEEDTSAFGSFISDTVPLTDKAVQELNRQYAGGGSFGASTAAAGAVPASSREQFRIGSPAQRHLSRISSSSSGGGSASNSPVKPPSAQQQMPLPQQQWRHVGVANLIAGAAGGNGNSNSSSGTGSDGGGGGVLRPRAGGAATAAATNATHAAAVPVSSVPSVTFADEGSSGVRLPNIPMVASVGATAGQLAATAAGDSNPQGGAAAEGASTPRSLSSIHTTDSAGTIERKKKKGLFASLKSKALKGRQQVR